MFLHGNARCFYISIEIWDLNDDIRLKKSVLIDYKKNFDYWLKLIVVGFL